MSTKSKKPKPHADGSVDAVEYMEWKFGVPTVGELLVSYREQFEVRQVELAKLLGLGRQSICDIEKGRSPVSPARALRFAELLQESPKLYLKAALQDAVRRAGAKFIVDVHAA